MGSWGGSRIQSLSACRSLGGGRKALQVLDGPGDLWGHWGWRGEVAPDGDEPPFVGLVAQLDDRPVGGSVGVAAHSRLDLVGFTLAEVLQLAGFLGFDPIAGLISETKLWISAIYKMQQFVSTAFKLISCKKNPRQRNQPLCAEFASTIGP